MRNSTVFISYAREDIKFAGELFTMLNGEFIPWMDKHSLVGGEDWETSIRKAVTTASFFIFCASSHSVNKRGAIQKELRLALDVWRGKLEDDIYFIPVRLDQCEVPDSVNRFQWIDAFEPNWENKVLHALRVGQQRSGVVSTPLPIVIEERTIVAPPGSTYGLYVSYPEFQPADSVGIADINAVLSVYSRRLAVNFEINDWVNIPGSNGVPNFLSVGFAVDGLSDKIISVRFSRSLHTGGAHPNHFTESFNFQRNPVRELELHALAAIGKESDLLKAVSDICTEDLIRQRTAVVEGINNANAAIDPSCRPNALDLDWTRKGAEPDWQNFKSFAMTPDGLKFFFDPYHVGSYAEGRYVTLVSYNLVAHLVRPEIRELFTDIFVGKGEDFHLKFDLEAIAVRLKKQTPYLSQ